MYYEDIPQKCQRPKRAYFISTAEEEDTDTQDEIRCQRPKRAYFISTLSTEEKVDEWMGVSTP